MTEIIESPTSSKGRFSDSVVTVGVFDGVHIGHRKVLSTLCALKKEVSASVSILITFDRHPLSVTRPEIRPSLLTTLSEKLSILGSLDLDAIIVDRFDEGTAGMDYRDFIRERLLDRLGMRHLVIGYDFHLGRGRMGNQQQLASEGVAGGFGVTVVPPVVAGGAAVSSTRIRKYIEERKLSRAARLLARPFFFDARVVHGEKLGRTFGFPTANLEISDADKLVPPHGVYAVMAEVGESRLGGMMNIGLAPTVRGDDKRRIEVHLFDFSGDLYGRAVRVHCLEYFREEKVFPDRRRLREQLMHDRDRVKGILEKKC